MKEYGGFLPIDTSFNEYYKDCDNYNVIRLNAARYAIVKAFFMSGCNHIYIPIYTCHSVIDALKQYKIKYIYYNIDEKIEPLNVSCECDGIVLVTNYFGVKNKKFYEESLNKFKNIIFDNTQSFYSEPILEKGIYNVYSPRKFFGVSDGAYIVCRDDEKALMLEKDLSFKRAGYLLSSYEQGTNQVYNDYLKAEEEINGSKMLEMSNLTRGLLGSVDYERIKNVRIRNFRAIHYLLKDKNKLLGPFIYDEEIVPMVYPFLNSQNENLRQYLINNNVYVPQWWKWVLKEKKANRLEKELSNYLIPLPIDQRYSTNDMEMIVKIVNGGLK